MDTRPETPPPTGPQRWPLRPWLSLGLLLCLLGAAGLLVVKHRGESTVGTVLGRVVGLGATEKPPPTPLSLLAFKSEGSWRIVDLEAAAETVAEARALIATGEEGKPLPCVQYGVTAEPFRRTGFWAPTTLDMKFSVTRTACIPGMEINASDKNEALDAVADQMSSRSLWAPMAREVRDFDGSTAVFNGEKRRSLKQGYIQNVVVLLVAVAFFFSLSKGRGTIHEVYDETVAIVRKLGVAALLGFLWTASPLVLGIALLYFLGDVAIFLRSNPTYGWFGYVAVFIVSAGVGFLPTYGQSFLGGWVFGFRLGFPGSMLGFVGGSMIGYAIAQRVSREKVMELLESNPKARRVRNALIGRGFWKTLGIVTLIRIPPNSPFALTNMILASSGVRPLPYVLGTAIGMAPRTGIAVWVAARGAATGARDIQEFVENQPWWAIPAGFVVLLVMLAILGWIANRALHEVTKDAAELDPGAD